MTTQEKLAAIRQACVTANPDIPLRVLLVDKKKPKVCVLSKAAIDAGLLPKKHREDGLITGESRDGKCWRVRWHKKDSSLAQTEAYSKNFIQIVEDENSEAEICLADVLLAMQEKWGRSDSEYQFNFIELLQHNDNGWNLRHDDLAAQPPETIDFLYDLLKIPHNV